MKSTVKFIIGILCVVALIGMLSALPTQYNPFTGKLDFFGLFAQNSTTGLVYGVQANGTFLYNDTLYSVAKNYTLIDVTLANSSTISWVQTYFVNKSVPVMNGANMSNGNITQVICINLTFGGYICDNGTAIHEGH